MKNCFCYAFIIMEDIDDKYQQSSLTTNWLPTMRYYNDCTSTAATTLVSGSGWCRTCFEEQKHREERMKLSKQTHTSFHSHINQYSTLNVSNSAVFKAESDIILPSQDEEQSEYETSDEEYEMELNSDFKQFLIQSARHKEERKRQREIAQAETDDYIEVNEIVVNATTVAPVQQQGVLRTKEMKNLYGRHSHNIESLETSLQLNFNMNLDMRNPVLWPSIPLKF